jgi:hypothetical protein
MNHVLIGRTYVDADRSAIVSEDSPQAAFLLGVAGDEVDETTASRLGLTSKEAAPMEPTPDSDPVPGAEPKARKR